jgi:hypothetical protein
MKKVLFPLLALVVLFSASCKKEDEVPQDNTDSRAPKITSLVADKLSIVSGPQDPATITCEAVGENLSYVWEVDLGDISPVDGSNGSIVKFTAADCCEGDREIKCKVSNEYGVDNASVTLHITVDYTL